MTEEKLNLPADAFEPLPKDEAQDNENIAGPSLSFAQNVWIRFKQRKAAVISAIIVNGVLKSRKNAAEKKLQN